MAFPAMKELMGDLPRRQANATGPLNLPVIMIGDLATKGTTTAVSKEGQDHLLGNISCQNLQAKTYNPPGPLGSPQCFADTCCVLDSVVRDLENLFVNSDGNCNDLARAAVRFGFHGAGTWSTLSGFGGANGSLLLNPDEMNRSENNGLQQICQTGLPLLTNYDAFDIGATDLALFVHNSATTLCPLGPRILTFVGCDDYFGADPPHLLPNTNSPPASLIDLFNNKTINFKDLIALIGAHRPARQFFVGPLKPGELPDSTPGIWDVKFYSETLQPSPPS